MKKKKNKHILIHPEAFRMYINSGYNISREMINTLIYTKF